MFAKPFHYTENPLPIREAFERAQRLPHQPFPQFRHAARRRLREPLKPCCILAAPNHMERIRPLLDYDVGRNAVASQNAMIDFRPFDPECSFFLQLANPSAHFVEARSA